MNHLSMLSQHKPRLNPRMQSLRHPKPGIQSLFDDEVINTTVDETQPDEKVRSDFSPIRLDVCDSRMRCFTGSPDPRKMLDPENSFCDKDYTIGPPMMIYGPFADEDISLLSSADLPNEVPGYQLPKLDLIGRRILGVIGIRDFSLPWNLCGPIHNPSHSSDENFRRRTLNGNSSFDANTCRMENFTELQGSQVTPTQEGTKDENETSTVVDTNCLLPRHCGSLDDSISMTLLEIRELSTTPKHFSIDESQESENNLMTSKAKSHHSNTSEKNLHYVFIESHMYLKHSYSGCRATLRTRKCCLILLWLGIVMTSVVIALTLSEKHKGKPKTDSRLQNSMSCQNKTNIIPDCTCQDRLQNPLSNEIMNRHTIVTWFLARTGAIKDAISHTAFPESCSVENQAILWLADYQWRSRSKLDFFQRYLLATIYQQLNGHKWYRNQNWISHESVCDWEGIVCVGPTYEIREINLMHNSLNGTLPNHELGLLTNLQKVRMENNPYLSGSLSSKFTALTSLHTVSLSNTSLSGAIPKNFSDSLEELHMSFTSLQGSLPTELGRLTSLRKLDLKRNQLSGTIPTEFRSLKHLEYIDLSWNRLTGSIPMDWKASFLNTLLINHNHNLSGQIPEPPSPLLIRVNFAHTSLSGRVPIKYCELKFLDAVIMDCVNGTKLKYCACCRCINAI